MYQGTGRRNFGLCGTYVSPFSTQPSMEGVLTIFSCTCLSNCLFLLVTPAFYIMRERVSVLHQYHTYVLERDGTTTNVRIRDNQPCEQDAPDGQHLDTLSCVEAVI